MTIKISAEMGVLVHPVAHAGNPKCKCIGISSELGIKWPDLPFTCPECDHEFKEHSHTVGLVDKRAYSLAKETLASSKRILAEQKGPTGRPIQAAEVARIKFAEDSARAILENPATFACSMCVVQASQQSAAVAALIDLLAK